MHASPRRLTAVLLLVSLAAQTSAAQAQKKSPPEKPSPEKSQPAPACDTERRFVNTKLDPQRTTALLAEAVSAINRLPDYDPFRPNVMRSLEGRTYYVYTFSPAPGFSLENVLKELAERDMRGMEAALEVAGALDDRHARALAVFASVSKCLADSKPKPAPNRTPAAKKPDAAPKPPATPKKRP